MNKTFEYFYVTQAADEINVQDIGNCIIEANTDDAEFYYLVTVTKMGVTRILEYGPFIDGGFPTFCSCSFTQLDYNEHKICKRIEKFLAKPGITQAQQLSSIEDIEANLIDLKEYLKW